MTKFVNNFFSTALSSATSTIRDSASTKIRAGNEQDELNWQKANELSLKAACELQMSNGDSVAGSLYKVESGGNLQHLFISANRRLPVNSLEDFCSAQLLLHVLPEDGCFRVPLSRDRVRHMWNTRTRREHIGNTVVELSEEVVEECVRNGANFQRIGEACTGEEVRLIIHLIRVFCKHPIFFNNQEFAPFCNQEFVIK